VRFGDIRIPRVSAAEPLKIECQHFLDCVRSRRSPRSDAADGLRVVRILEAAQQSMEQDGTPVPLRGQNELVTASDRADRCWSALRV
jgi:predicted dehydrogenase